MIGAVQARAIISRRVAALLLACLWMWCGRDEAAAQKYVWTTFVGRAGHTNGGDGVGTNAFFNQPSGGAMDATGNFYVADEYNDAIRKVTPDGTVTTFAGVLGVAGTNDGTGSTARFTQPTNLIFDKDGNMYVADTYAHTIRKITPAGVVTTLAGLGGVAGSSNGTGSAARFNEPNGIGYDPISDVLYVADGNNGAIRKVTRTGVVTTVAGGGQAEGQLYFGVEQVAVSPSQQLYVLDAYNSTIWTMTTNGGNATVLAGPGAGNNWPQGSGSADGTGSAAQFSFPESLWLDAAGNAFVADYSNDTIRKVTPAGVVTTIGGQAGVIGTADGTNTAALFNLEEGIFVDPWGNLYVTDTQNHTVRIGYAGPPAVISPPQNLTAPAGASPSFTISARAAAPNSAYQWRFNGVALTNNAHVLGAQSNVLSLISLAISNSGTYEVIVTNAYGATNASATLTVTQAIPSLTWTNPVPLNYGTALSSIQLNASANVPGNYVYTPPAGTVLKAGTNNLTVSFTPIDTVDYTSATGTVSLVVQPAILTITATNSTKVYGQTRTFAGTEFTTSGLHAGDSVTNVALTSLGAPAAAPVGNYPIIASGATGIGLSNYTIGYSNGILAVTAPTPVRINSPILLSRGTIKLTFSGGDPGVAYRIQTNSDLASTNWKDIFTNLAGSSGLPPFTNVNATNPGPRFYRTVTP